MGLAVVVVFSVLRAITAFVWYRLFGSIDFHPTFSFLLFSLAVFTVMSVGLIGGGLFWLARASCRELGWQREGLPKAIGFGFLGLVLIFIIQMIYGIAMLTLFGPPPGGVPLVSVQLSPSRMLLMGLWGFFIAAWQEENLYRGYLQPLLIEQLGYRPGIIAQAALFSVAHIGWFTDWRPFVSAFAIGLVLGWMRGRNRSLVAPFVAHGLSWLL